MNPETKHFEPETPSTARDWRRFKVGETYEVNGVVFVVQKITKKDLVLRPKR